MHNRDVTVRVADCSIGLTAGTPAAVEQLRQMLGQAAVVEDKADIELALGDVMRPRRRSDHRQQHVAYWQDGADRVIATSPAATARISGARAVLDPGADGGGGLHTLLFPVLSELLAARGRCVVHAAAFVQDSRAVLALGGSGQGKSTLVAAMLAADHVILSDDLVVLRIDDGQLMVAGVPQPLALPADLADHPAVGVAITGDHRGRHSPPADTWLDTSTHPLAVVLVVAHSKSADGQLLPATPREIFHWTLASCWEGGTVGRAHQALPFAAAVSRVPAWHVGHAHDPHRRIAAAGRHVDEAVRLSQLRDAPGPTG